MRIWHELRRRRVFRLTGLYVVGAWLVIQVGDIFFPAWGLPETALRYLFIAAFACFPVALVFGWFYDVTPQGIVRTEPAGESETVNMSLKRKDYVVLTALLAVGVAVVLGSFGKIQEEIQSGGNAAPQIEKPANSIAVLPFVNLDADSDTRYFSDGITEEILHRLSTLRALHVLASTSSFAFRDSEEGPAGISDKLGVQYLLQGSVRLDNDYVRVTARLLDENGFQVWSDRFDRRLASIFAIQTEIASKVSTHIVNEIVPPQQLPAGRTTDNMDAYDAYLRGRSYFDSRAGNWKQQAATLFDRAIELDPGYAPPYAGKATLVVNSPVGPQWEEARDLALKSLELDPDLPLGNAVLGLTLAVLDESERAIESLRRAIELDPSLGVAYSWITMPLEKLGLPDEVRAMADRGLEIDPLNPLLLRNAAPAASRIGDFDRAEQLLLRLTGLPDPPWWIHLSLGELYAEWGQYADALAIAKSGALASASDGDDPLVDQIALAYAAVGLTEDAEYWFELLRGPWDDAEGPPMDADYFLAAQGARLDRLFTDLEQAEVLSASDGPHDMSYQLTFGGLTWTFLGNQTKGIEWIERGISLYQQDLVPEDPPDEIDWSLLSRRWGIGNVTPLAERLAFAYGATGRDEDAERALQILEQVAADITLPTNPLLLEKLALVRVLAGDPDTALDYLRQAVELGWADYYGVANDPAWAVALEAPEFEAVLAGAKANNDRQRAIIVASDAEHDFRAEFDRVLSVQTEARQRERP